MSQPPIDWWCPVCRERVDGFTPISAAYTDARRHWGTKYPLEDCETLNTEQYHCGRCGATDRSRLYALFINERLRRRDRTRAFRILDVAPDGPLRSFLDRWGSEGDLDYVPVRQHARADELEADVTRLVNHPDSAYDLILCSHVLEHVPDDRAALAELHRVLHPSGQAIIMVPVVLSLDRIAEDPSVVTEAERWRCFGQGDHVRAYSKNGFTNRLREAGFWVSELGVGHFGEDTFRRCGLTARSILYVANKPQENVHGDDTARPR